MTLLVYTLLLGFIGTSVQSNKQKDKVFFIKRSSGGENETMLVVRWTAGEQGSSAGCEIFKDKDLINEVLKSSGDMPIPTFREGEMDHLLDNCTEFNFRRRRDTDNDTSLEAGEASLLGESNALRNRRNRKRPTAPTNRTVRRITTTTDNDIDPTPQAAATTTAGYDGLPVIFPGTKWCGAGDIAKNYDDLGLHQDTDRCCRAHDLCNDTLAPGETRNNLTNTSPFTKLSCKCDHDFWKCLDRVNTMTSNTIGNLYFNVLKRECYKQEYPLTKTCKRYATFFRITCLEYKRNTKARKVYQWISAKKYKKIPFPGPLTVTLPF